MEALGRALAFDLPRKIGQRAGSGRREALCLGPDEWLVTTPEGASPPTIARAAVASHGAAPHAPADITDRELSYRLAGPGAVQIAAMGCPRDLRTIAPGEAVHAIFHNVTAILWRDGPDAFRIAACPCPDRDRHRRVARRVLIAVGPARARPPGPALRLRLAGKGQRG